MAGLTPQDLAYLVAQAKARGHDPDDVQRVFGYESSNDPSRWGGKGNKYFGLFQAGPEERARYHIDTVHPSARNQIDAFFNFLNDRGYKPNMGLLDMYSTVNAGSPGHYNASDGNGTVASHVAKMMGQTPATGPNAALSYAPAPAPANDPIGQLLQGNLQPQRPDPIAGLLSQGDTQPQPMAQDNSMNDALLRQMQDFHNQRHMMSVQGLL